MGTSQSAEDGSSTGRRTDQRAAKMRKDFYAVLGVDQVVDQDEIKRAYRKKALELHPDKNVHNVEQATELFSEVQAAYEVLSDPQERAWYDSHKEQILRDDHDDEEEDANEQRKAAARAENISVTTAEILKQFSLFSSRMDMRDNNPRGFYATADKIFEKLAAEEEYAASKLNIDYDPYPRFGNSVSSYEYDVKRFYSSWASFVTLKSFAWEDKYHYRDAPDRRIKRLMEKENRKLREAAIKEFNDAVKHFVLFVRKRDPRYIPNFQSEEQRNAAAREISKDQSRKARLENAAKLANYTEADWTRTDDTLQYGETDEEEESDPTIEFECVVCDKTFKTEKQVEMHEKSKKHIKSVHLLKRQMEIEGKSLGLDSGGKSESVQEQMERYSSSSDVPNETQVSNFNLPPEALGPTEEIDGPLANHLEATIRDKSHNQHISSIAVDSIDKHVDRYEENARMEEVQAVPSVKPSKKTRRKAKEKSNVEPQNKCGICGGVFESRTKLFKHIREEDHATPVERRKV